ncbi:MAG: CinA family nicotinamide mononucleotide deamidase-related protein [Bacteroidales bacterium]
MKIEIITIGDEILIGQIVDTNSAWMATEINKLGWEVIRITTIGDTREEIIQAFDDALGRADVVLVTGGTGPTKDDVTKNVLCEYFGGTLIFDPAILENVKGIFAQRSLRLNALTESQAWVPDNCEVIMNKVGTAPCTWFERNGKVLVSMAGVPAEMKWLMSNGVLPKLEERFHDGSAVLHHTFMVKNYSESALAEYLSGYEADLPAEFKLAYLPQPGVLRLRLTGRNSDKGKLEHQMQVLVAQMHARLGKDLFSDEDLPLPEIIGKLLLQKGVTLATAESCTGGAIAAMITAIPGSSAYFKGGVVSYANEVKNEVLGVDRVDIERSGAVSETVVRQMAAGAARVCKADCAVATSGVAGPDGGSVEKPVGTVWIAAKYKDEVVSRLFTFGKSRSYNITRASNAALLLLLELLVDENIN